MNAILGFADLLDLGIAAGTQAKESEYLARIRKNADHLLEIINDILDWSKIEAGQLTVDAATAPVSSVVTEALDVVRDQAAARSLALAVRCAEGASYLGDPLRVRQILINLLSNAIKFTPTGGQVTLACATANSRTAFSVEDTGMGIAPSELETIFRPFVQVERGYTRTHGGTGLGLSISRRLAELMGGEVTVVSAVGKGSTFTLTLPSRERRQAPRPSSRVISDDT